MSHTVANVRKKSSSIAPFRIAITGPESTGKTTLAQALAQALEVDWLPEYARSYLEALNRPYTYEDYEAICRGQIEAVQSLQATTARSLFVCDTELMVLKVWGDFKYGRVPTFVDAELKARPADLYVLCGLDVPWIYDPLREHPEKRAELYHVYRKHLQEGGLPMIEVAGSLEERLETCRAVLTEVLGGAIQFGMP